MSTARLAKLCLALVLLLLVPACELRDGKVRIEGPAISPEASTAISLGASLL